MTRRIAILVGLLFASVAAALPCYTLDGTPYRPRWTHVYYEWQGDNTAVLMRLSCGGAAEDWYVGFFEGHGEPTLREFADIQNAASLLLP